MSAPVIPDPQHERGPVSFYVDRHLVERARAVIGAHLPSGPATLSGLVEQALSRFVTTLERDHNGGEPFPPLDGQLPVGRPPRQPTLMVVAPSDTQSHERLR